MTAGPNQTVPKITRRHVVVVGNSCVGKTALMHVLSSGLGSFPRNYSMTLGIEVFTKTFPQANNTAVELVLIDCSGDELYSDVVSQCWQTTQQQQQQQHNNNNSCVLCVVYDVCDNQSYQAVNKWIEKMHMTTNDKCRGILIGNKSDCNNRRVVSEKMGQDLAKQHKLMFYECSAKSNAKVFDAFKALAQQLATSEN